MTKSSHTQAGALWRTDWFAGVVVVVVVVLLQLSTDWMSALEYRLYDLALRSSSRIPSDRVAIIAIDDKSIANIGQWPWPRDVHARLIDQLAAAQAGTVVYTTPFAEAQANPALVYLRQIQQALDQAAEAGADMTASTRVSDLVEQAQTALDGDAVLAASLQRAGNVLLPSVFVLGQPQGKPAPAPLDYAQKSTLDGVNGLGVKALRVQQPIALLGRAAAGVGHLNPIADGDGAGRTAPLLVDYNGKAVPSIALLAAVRSLNLDLADIVPRAGGALQIGHLRIPADEAARVRPQFYSGHAGKPAFALDSFYDVLSGKLAASSYAGKIVIIGVTAAGLAAQSTLPGFAALTPAETVAHLASSILSGHFYLLPSWSAWATLAALGLVAAYVVAGLPRLSGRQGAAISALMLVLLLGLEFGLLLMAATWIQLVFPATALLLGHLALAIKRFATSEVGKAQQTPAPAGANRMMGLALQGQGQLDLAFERFCQATMGEALQGNLYSLALDFERKHQFTKAQAVYHHMAAFDPGYQDILAKLARAKALSEADLAGGVSAPSSATPQLPDTKADAPMLGRYLLEKELGKGSMGVVYLGRDPKIGRVVAIKTLALSQEFAGDALADARERFFREAQTAGRLQHQDIVTIFDAGEEHDLAYIAMEFLKGQDLAQHCKPGHLLAPDTVLAIVARVARALAYAHQQNVVHRDIKPANIMFDAATDSVKVTDFGIARITDSGKTRTGMVLGTPSFMSPEQLAGKKVDGRSDLYSLGVMLYHMLAGELPFRGGSMSELMYKIANEEAADIRSVRPELSEALAHVVALAMSKRPETRYQTGEQFAADLQAVAAVATGGADIEI